MSSGLPGAFPSEDVVVKKTETTTLREPATTGSPYEPATTAITTKTTTTTEAPLSTHTAALVDPAAESTTDGPDFAEEAKRLAGEAMTAAAAIGLAAKDAVLAAKDAAMPVVTDAAVAARDVAVPAVTDAAVATRDAAVPAANVASEKVNELHLHFKTLWLVANEIIRPQMQLNTPRSPPPTSQILLAQM